MPVRLPSPHAIEQSTFAVEISFTDEEGAALIPNSGLTWTLTDKEGTVINARQDVAITSASTVTVVLSGGDLNTDDGNYRVLTIEGTYNSSLGNNLPLKDQAEFYISDLVAVT